MSEHNEYESTARSLLEKRISELEASNKDTNEAFADVSVKFIELEKRSASHTEKKASKWDISNAERISGLEKWNKSNVGIAQYNIWKQEIAELRLKVDNPEWLDVLILDLIKPQIDELKECLEIAANRDKFLSDNDGLIIQELKQTQKVLQDLLAEIFIFTYPDDPEERKKVEVQKYRELLEKLDVRSARQTVKKEVIGMFSKASGEKKEEFCQHLNIRWVSNTERGCIDCSKIMDSGGEKTVRMEKDGNQSMLGQPPNITDSKPPEPIIHPYKREVIEFLEEQGNIVVKREDLEWMFKNLWIELGDYNKESQERIKRIKEEYGIE